MNVEIIFDNRSQPVSSHLYVGPPSLKEYGVHFFDRGSIALTGPGARIFSLVNKSIVRFGQRLNAQETILPSTLSRDDLERTDHQSRFPQFTTFLKTFNTYHAPERACRSAVCQTLYPCYAGQVFSESQRRVFTSAGVCFRNEDEKAISPIRLNEFQTREIIVFGTAEQVKDLLRQCEDWLISLLRDGGLRGVVQTSHDPFTGVTASQLQAFQVITRAKVELGLTCWSDDDREVLLAVASVNQHGTYFSKAYELKFSDREFIHTGCFGVGLERLTLALISQYGPDVSEWPPGLRSILSE